MSTALTISPSQSETQLGKQRGIAPFLNMARRELARIQHEAPLLAGFTIFLALMSLPTLMAMALDDRLHNGINIWIKPFKFDVALLIYIATLAVFVRWVPTAARNKAWFKVFTGAVIVSVLLEILWVKGAAAAGIGSHFNVASPLMAAAYTIAGLGALILTSGALVYGALIWRNKNTGLSSTMHFAIWFGSVSMALMTIVTASYMAAQSGHLVGGNLLDTEAMPIMGWATDGGDLRVSHFFASHIIHFLPIFVLMSSWLFKRTNMAGTIGAAAFYCAFTFYTLWEAINGHAFLGSILG